MAYNKFQGEQSHSIHFSHQRSGLPLEDDEYLSSDKEDI